MDRVDISDNYCAKMNEVGKEFGIWNFNRGIIILILNLRFVHSILKNLENEY